MIRAYRVSLVLLALGTGVMQQAAAESDIFSATGSVRGAYFSSSRQLDEVDQIGSSALWLKGKAKFTSNASLTAEGWLQYDSESSVGRRQSRVREAYLDLAAGKLDLRIGRQIIAWGRADKLNPTDNLTPRDYTLQMVDDEEQRLPGSAILVRLPLQDRGLGLSAVWMPQIRPNVAPIRKSAGVVFTETVPNTNQFAIKLDNSGGELDWSVSYLDGVNLNPELGLSGVSARGVEVYMRHKRVQTLGADAATTLGRYGVRAEMAYTRTKVEADPIGNFTAKPFFYMVLGADRTFDNGINANLQLFAYRVFSYSDPRLIGNPLVRSIAIESANALQQLDRNKQGISFRINQKWLNDTLEAEVTTIYSFSTADYAIKPKLIYAINDHLKLTTGMDWFRGHQDSFFGRIRDSSTFFAELKYSF